MPGTILVELKTEVGSLITKDVALIWLPVYVGYHLLTSFALSDPTLKFFLTLVSLALPDNLPPFHRQAWPHPRKDQVCPQEICSIPNVLHQTRHLYIISSTLTISLKFHPGQLVSSAKTWKIKIAAKSF